MNGDLGGHAGQVGKYLVFWHKILDFLQLKNFGEIFVSSQVVRTCMFFRAAAGKMDAHST